MENKDTKERLSFLVNYLMDWMVALNDEDKDRFLNFRVIEGGNIGAVLPFPGALQFNSLNKMPDIENTEKEQEVLKYQGKKILKRKDNRYQSSYYDNGIRKFIYGKTQSECYEKLKAALNKKPAAKQKQTVKASNQKLSEYLLNWFDLYRVGKRAPSTVKKDKNNINNINRELGDYRLSELTPLILQKYFNDVTGDRQREHLFVLLRHALRKAVDLKIIKDSPMSVVEIKKYETSERYVLSTDEEKKFIEIIKNSKFENYYKILLYQGLRPGELAALKSSHIKDDHMTIRNSIDELGNLKETKTKSGRRNIPIFPEAAQALQDYKPLVVCLDDLRDELKKITGALGLPASFQLYNLRHTCITRWAQKGVHVKVVQKWAGHKTIEITLKYYTHVSSEWETAEADKVRGSFDTQTDTQTDNREPD